MAELIVWVTWGVIGVVLGGIGANYMLDDLGQSEEPFMSAILAGMVFITCVAVAPLILGGLVLVSLAWCGAWALPAFRKQQRGRPKPWQTWQQERRSRRSAP